MKAELLSGLSKEEVLIKVGLPEWHTTEPPKDGTPIVAVGRVIYGDEFSTISAPFAAAIFWASKESGFEGWCLWLNEYKLAVAQTLEDDVKIDFWMPYPNP